MLTLARYHDLGGVQGALTRHADAALAEAVRVSNLEVLAGLTQLPRHLHKPLIHQASRPVS
jgi:hypothetical protein